MKLLTVLSIPLREIRDIRAYTHSRDGQIFTDGVWIGGILGVVATIIVLKTGVLNV